MAEWIVICVLYPVSCVSMVIEKDIESAFVSRIESLGGIAEKTVSLGGRGYFDRIAVLPGGRVIFAEIKKPKGSRTTPHQRLRHRRYLALGVEAVVIKTLADIDRLLGEA